jgi:hypothetical protein
MSVSDETLMAYADDALDPADRAAVETALAADPALRARLAAHRRLQAGLRIAFDDALSEPVPERLVAAVHARPAAAPVVDLAARRAARWSTREWSAMAASLAAGAILAFGFGQSARPPAPDLVVAEGGLAADGALARALEQRLAADQGAGAARIGISFRDKDGRYCRSFNVETVAGLACREDAGWRVALVTAGQGDAGGDVRQAGAATPPEVLAAIEARMAGDALDAAEEAAARDAGWRAAAAP